MNYKQILNRKSVDNNEEKMKNMSFNILYDPGNLYPPGKKVCVEHHVVVYCQSNCGAVFMAEGEHYYLQRGDMVLVKPNTVHGFVSYNSGKDPYAGYVVSFSQEYVDSIASRDIAGMVEYSQKSKLVRTRGTLWERIDAVFMMALEEINMKAPGWETALFGSSMVLLVQIARAAAYDPADVTKVEKTELLSGILAYVENNLSEKITLEDVANRFFVSASTVTHLFSKKMNISFYKHVMQRRLWKAKNLIKEGMPMEKIANQVGFGDYSAFYRAFKQEFGLSPRQFYKESHTDTNT